MTTDQEIQQNIALGNENEEIFNLQKELVLLRIKQKTKQNIKTSLFKKIKYKISQILVLNNSLN